MEFTLQLVGKFAASLYLVIAATATLYRQKRSRAAMLYALMVTLAAGWALLNALNEYLIWIGQPFRLLWSLGGVLSSLAALVILLFAIDFPRNTRKYGWIRFPAFLLFATIVPFAFLPNWIISREFEGWQLKSHFGWPYFVTSVGALLLAASGVALLIQKHWAEKDRGTRIQINGILVSIASGVFMIVVFAVILPIFGYSQYFFVAVFSIALLGASSLRTLRLEGVFDLKRGIKSVLSQLILFAAIQLPIAIASSLLIGFLDLDWRVIAIASALITSLMFNRLLLSVAQIPGVRQLIPREELTAQDLVNRVCDGDWQVFTQNLQRELGSDSVMITSRGITYKAGEQESNPEIRADLTVGDAEEVNVLIGSIGGIRAANMEERGLIRFLVQAQSERNQLLDLSRREYSEETLNLDLDRDVLLQLPDSQETIQLCRTYAKGKESVLIRGETGTGKEYLARFIHQSSDRSTQPLIVIDCASLPANLVEAELFGYEKGAFTGAGRAHRGFFERGSASTILLDEIGELSLEMQAKLLRVINERTFYRIGGTEPIQTDARFVFATHRNLEEMISNGQFRADLYYRMNVLTVDVSPLRERPRDLQMLATFFAVHDGNQNVKFSASAMNIIKTWAWPGNVRELRNIVSRAVIQAGGVPIQPKHLGLGLSKRTPQAASLPNEGIDFHREVAKFEKQLLEFYSRGRSQSETARVLKLERGFLRRKLQQHELF